MQRDTGHIGLAGCVPPSRVHSLIFLALLGSLAARTGGAPMLTAAALVTFWGALAMALTAGVGTLVGVLA